MSKSHTKEVHKTRRDKAEEGMTIKVPKASERNPFAIFQERKQIMKNPKDKRTNNPKRDWRGEDYD